MASLRRSKVLSPDGQTAKFLYTIIKQLDLKVIDWNEVASGLDITNGHAARMRYSRFKSQIEGLPTQSSKPRAPRTKKDSSATSKGKGKNKPGYEPGKVDDWKDEEDDGDVKMEQGSGFVIKKEGLVNVKQEESTLDVRTDAAIDHIQVKQEPGLVAENILLSEVVAKVKQEPTVESTNFNLSPTSGIASININSSSTLPPTPTVSTLGFSPGPATPKMIYSQRQAPPMMMMPPRATVSLADLQLPPIPRPTSQVPLPEFSYTFTPMDFGFDFNASMPQPQMQPLWQPQFDMFCPVTLKQETMHQ